MKKKAYSEVPVTPRILSHFVEMLHDRLGRGDSTDRMHWNAGWGWL